MDKKLVNHFTGYEPIVTGNLATTAFPKLHDASDPYSFVVMCNGVKVGVFTDIGAPCRHVINHFKDCHAAFLEANYDEEMLANGSYPFHLKKRIAGQKGHLSNKQALELFKKHKPSFMSHLLLSHLSKNNNCPDLVQKLFEENAGGVKMIVASRFEETAVYRIFGNNNVTAKNKKPAFASQMSFSFG